MPITSWNSRASSNEDLPTAHPMSNALFKVFVYNMYKQNIHKTWKNIINNFICMAFRYIRFVLGLLFKLHLSEVNRNHNLSESFGVFQTHICTSFRKIKGVLGPKVIFQNFFFGPIVENQVLVQKFLRLVHRTFVAPPSLAQPFIRWKNGNSCRADKRAHHDVFVVNSHYIRHGCWVVLFH